jgi:glycosyltransferase involved in cell wall biosynthesis
MSLKIEGRQPEPATGVLAEDLLVGANSDVRPVISVVFPTLDEEAGIGECIRRTRNAVSELGLPTEILVSDDSTDRTPEIAREAGAIVVEPDRSGYGYAYRYAFERARGDYVVMGDADTTYDFEELPAVFERLQEADADMVLGSRLDGEIKPGAMPRLHQYVGNPMLTRFLNAFYDAEVSDAHSGFRVVRREALAAMDLSSDGMEFASEMIMEAAARDMDIAEAPITYHERTGDATLDSFRDGWRHVRFMLVNAPGYLFTVPGLYLGLVGALLMGLAFSGLSLGSVSFGVHSMIAGSLLTILGYQTVSFGVFAIVEGSAIRANADPVSAWVVDTVRLEHAATIGAALTLGGGVYATLLVARWATSGFTRLPFVMGDVVAFTAIVLGIQTVFGAFFFSVLAGDG